MIIYNITTHVNWAIHDEWLQWTQAEYIPLVMQTGYFSEPRILKLLQVDEEEGPTYAIQFHASSINDYLAYINEHAASMNQLVTKKWNDQSFAFASVMEVLH